MSKEHKVGLAPNAALEMLDKVSPTFCLAKWLQVTLNLHTGTNASCCLTPPSKVDLNNLKYNIHEFHNTKENKSDRKDLLEGKKTSSCQFCWVQETKGSKETSERVYKSASPWAHENLDKVLEAKEISDIAPTYLEVSFSSKCNLKCAYCSPQTSSSIFHEVKKHGPYTDSSSLNDIREIEKNFKFSEFEDQNPYIPKFYEWFSKISKGLKVLRFTGGEPLLAENVFKVFQIIKHQPHPELTIEINSNLSLPEAVIHRLIKVINEIPKENFKGLKFISSIDTGFAESAYVRNGLNVNFFKHNVDLLLKELPDAEFRFTVTFSLFSIVNFTELIEYTLKLKRDYKTYDKILLSIYPLISPYHLSLKSLPQDFKPAMDKILHILENNKLSDEEPYGFNEYEIDSFKKIYDFYLDKYPNNLQTKLQRDFFYFIQDFDHRKGTSFLKTFPELKQFFEMCSQYAHDDLQKVLTSAPSTLEDFKKLVMFVQRVNSFDEAQRSRVLEKIEECISRMNSRDLTEALAVTREIYNQVAQEKISLMFFSFFQSCKIELHQVTQLVWGISKSIKIANDDLKKQYKDLIENVAVSSFEKNLQIDNEVKWAWLDVLNGLEIYSDELCDHVDRLFIGTPSNFGWGIYGLIKNFPTEQLDKLKNNHKQYVLNNFKTLLLNEDEFFWAWLEIVELLDLFNDELYSILFDNFEKIPLSFSWGLLRVVKKMSDNDQKRFKDDYARYTLKTYEKLLVESRNEAWAWLELVLKFSMNDEQLLETTKGSFEKVPVEYSWGLIKLLDHFNEKQREELKNHIGTYPLDNFKHLLKIEDDHRWAWVDIINKLEYEEPIIWDFIEKGAVELNSLDHILKVYRWNEPDLWIQRFNGQRVSHWVYEAMSREDENLTAKFFAHIKPKGDAYSIMIWYFLTNQVLRNDILKFLEEYSSEENKKLTLDFIKNKLPPNPLVMKRVKLLKQLILK